MSSNHTMHYPSGLFIPVEDKSLFMVAFEDRLVSAYNVVPLFGPANRANSCEVKFNYLGNKLYKPGSLVSDLEKAVGFLKENMSILESRKSPRRKRKSNRLQTPTEVINLEDDGESRTVDLTYVNQGEPEVIILEDSIIHPARETRRSSRNSSVVDLTDINESFKATENRKVTENEIEILSVKIFQSQNCGSMLDDETTTKPSNCSIKQNNRKKRKKKGKKRMSQSRTTPSQSSTKSTSNTSQSSIDSLPRKKRKLQDISNISPAASCSDSPSFIPLSDLSDNTRKYYEFISKVVGKLDDKKKTMCISRGSPVRNQLQINAKGKKGSLAKKMSPVTIHLQTNKKRKIFIPQNNVRHKSILNHRRKDVKVLSPSKNSPRRSRRTLQKGISNHVRSIGQANAFNPNPCEVDLEGLRPIVIDGSNIAIGHGKGKFSPKGLKICVDYFVARGHSKIKVFLPQFRQEEISVELLEALKSKCDVVFTPSQCINGQRKTPYDDRFIVQYACEFGGVIVSTDNYRDLLRENPRWQDTIQNRLLMFTWVDDFLMFPVDPLGRSGPTLEEFLKF